MIYKLAVALLVFLVAAIVLAILGVPYSGLIALVIALIAFLSTPQRAAP